jgi:tetratricopeptide (TPR) repeat protein
MLKAVRAVFTAIAKDNMPLYNKVEDISLGINQGIRVLCDHWLAEADTISEGSEVESRGYSMHNCVHSWTVHVLNQEWDAEMGGLALKCVGSRVPKSNARNSWATRQRLIRHTARCWSFIVDGMADKDSRA